MTKEREKLLMSIINNNEIRQRRKHVVMIKMVNIVDDNIARDIKLINRRYCSNDR